VFRVTTAQLQAHAGQVRCGRCMQVFNALAELAPEPAPLDTESVPQSTAQPVQIHAPVEMAVSDTPLTVEPLSPEAVAIELPSDVVADTAVEAEPETEAAPDPVAEPEPAAASEAVAALQDMSSHDSLPESVGDDAGAVANAGEAGDNLDAGIPDAVAAVEAAPEQVTADTQADADNPFVQTPVNESSADPRRRGFAVAGAVLLMLLAGQAVFFYRSEVAARYPLARQWLASLCVQAGCTVTLPQQPQSILIEASDLQVSDPANPNRIQLTATLRNHAGHDVAYPALDLVLTNVNDHTLARRIFLPEDYLAGGRDVRAGIPANAEMTVRLALETGNLGAAGFRLAVLSAPAR
jgi:predicted Zn finger-like uncharacterized protein